ncbi:MULTISPECIES: hypothetical protein [unclassified Novosphingobium]|uniref:hypothetical protein n=1 Tax=unclassified Novosphingobium TaxID=2644732 RepID=UPI000EDB0B61|nr:MULTISPECIES: hypothetical protein [unclassified Novosphingobium]HCF25219.1 hypothetical protein [Novosphingobium sp.]HQV02368.1 hypothetical protein [Novosphingobium sp.]
MSIEFGDLTTQIAGDGRITNEEILELRRLGWADGKMSPDEAESLFVANETAAETTPEWCDFFCDALTSFVVYAVEPRGYVDAEMAEELVSRVDRDGRVGTMAELELLVRVIEVATSVPQALRDYALKQIEEAVVLGEGPTRHGALSPHGVNATEVTLLKRLIFGTGSERPAGVSKAEAELLFRIKDATLHDANAPEWTDLFVKGVAQFLLGFGGHEALSEDRAAELESFMAREGQGVGGFLGRMASAAPNASGFGSLLKIGGDEADYLEEWDDSAESAASLEPAEHSWLQDMLEADEDLDELEKALIAFIDAETGETFVPRPKG